MMRHMIKKSLAGLALMATVVPMLVVPIQSAFAFNTGSVSPLPTVLTLAAAGKKADLSTFTLANNTVLSNGAYWYWRDKYTFGISPNSTVNIDATKAYDICASSLDASCSPGSGLTRMSWKISSTSMIPGGRIGSRVDITTGTASRMCFYASTQPTYFPSGIQRNVAVSTITSGGWIKNAESYFTATSYPDQNMLWCLGNGSAVANFFMVGSYDPTATNIQSFSPRSTTSNDGSIIYDLQFTEAVSGLAASDFSLTGTGSSNCTVGTPSGSGANYVVTLTGCTAGTVVLSINANSVTGTTTGPAVTETAVTVTVVEVATTISLVIANAVIYKGMAVQLTATVSQPGRVTFTANNKRIGTCVAVVAASTTALCNWKPAFQGPVTLKASLKPASGSYTASTSLNILVAPQKRTTTR
jgi:hypothetical protein